MSASALIYYKKPAQNLSRFPALLHFFRCLETSGAGLTCAKTGLYWEPYELEFDAATRTVWPNKTSATFDEYTPVSQPWQTFPDGYSILHLFVVNVQDELTVRCRIGFASDTAEYYGTSARTGIHMGMRGTAGNFAWPVNVGDPLPAEQLGHDIAFYSTLFPSYDPSLDFETGVVVGGVNVSHIEVLDGYGAGLGLGYELTSSPSSSGSASTAVPGSISPTQVCNWSGGKYYGAAWFAFRDGLPADLDVAIAWMAKSWRTGNRAIYPPWEGLF